MQFTRSIMCLLVLAVAGCAGGAPYVHKPYEINRELEDFPVGPPVEEGTMVTVCYAKANTSPGDIRALADEECARGGLNAIFNEQSFIVCPLTTPAAAQFTCTGAVVERGEPFVGGAGAPATTAPASPRFDAPKPAGLGRSFGAIGAGDVSTTAKSQPFPTYLFNSPQQNR